MSDVRHGWRFVGDLRRFLKKRISIEDARAEVRRRLLSRETNFLRTIERGIFGHARSPYLPLLELADCALPDIQTMVGEKGLLNVENDDCGAVDTRPCGCPLGLAGFTERLREIRSFSKLTGEGVTLVGSEMTTILEEVLPARFGGSPLSYQLVEEEEDDGLTRLTLLVSPSIVLADEGAVIQVLLDALRASSVGADQARATWQQAGTLRLRRMDPIWTARGKLMPLHRTRSLGTPASTA